MAGNTASRVLRATPAATREMLSSLSLRQTRSRMSRQPARGISLGVRAARPRPGSARSAFCGSDCESVGSTPPTEQPLFPRPRRAMIAENQRLRARGRGDVLLGAVHGPGDEMMMRREIADRIGVGRIARQQIGLAPAAAKVPSALRAAAARFLHPGLTAVAVERRRVVPDRADARLPDARKGEARQHSRRLAGQGDSIRRDAEEYPPETVHAGLRPGLEVVGHYEEDPHARAHPLAKARGDFLRAAQLVAARKQLPAVAPRPAVVLGVGELDVLGAHA